MKLSGMMNSNVSLIYKSHTIYTILIKILYGKYFLSRYRDLRSYIPPGDTVLDVCSGDCNLYHLAVKGRNQYTGVDLNISRLKKNKNIYQKQLDIIEDSLPEADIIILQGSLYQFHPNQKMIIDKLLSNAKKKVIISEPIINIANSENSFIAYIAKYAVNPGTGHKTKRFTRQSLDHFFQTYYNKIIESRFLIAGGRDLVYILNKDKN
tara:strand:- start:697 stop:1320 length:624 start_codon:yes stop_codon:yes gene_type:complete